MKTFSLNLLRTALLGASTFGLLAALAPQAAQAADAFPNRPVRILVNSAAGALLDVTTRAVAQVMAENLGQAMIVDNRPGADGQLGIRALKTYPADGYTLLTSANTLAQLPALKIDPGYDLVKDFTGIGMMNQAPLLMVGPPGQPAKTLAEFIAQAKANPDKMTYASGGVGTSTHMAAALFVHQAGVRMLHVPYKGNAGAMPDLLGGRVNVLFDGGNSSGPHIKEGRLRAFGITAAQRSAAFPDIPTLAEQGLKDYSFSVWLGMVALSATPRDVVQRLAQALRVAQGSNAVRDRFRRDGAEAVSMSPDEFTAFLKRDMERSVKVAADLGMPKE